MEKTKKHYSTSEVAQILHISRISIFNRIKRGRIRAERVGKTYIISHESLLEALGKSIGKENKEHIDQAVSRALTEYAEVFKKLGKE